MTPITELRGVGNAVAKKLERLDIHCIEDLLFHLPLRYQDRTRVHPIAALRPGSEALVEGTVEQNRGIFKRRRAMIVTLADNTGILLLRFFHFSNAQRNSLRQGTRLRCFGEIRRGRSQMEMVHPEYQFANSYNRHTKGSYTPIYPATEGLQQFSLRKLTDEALYWMATPSNELEELLPPNLAEKETAISLKDALRYVHRPPADADIELLQNSEHPAQKRLAFEEILAHSMSLRRTRKSAKHQPARPLNNAGELLAQLKSRLPFTLTMAQERVIEEIRTDVRESSPMMRLVQGDVGSGKTLVGVAAMLEAVEAGCQAAMMAPTELLAEQHYHNLKNWFDPFEIGITLILGKQKVGARRHALRQARNGETQIVVGTHALFQEKVEFKRLALIVVDEQHRFGVHQRLALKQKGEDGSFQPHQLIMTATPIPRSLAMTMYADLDYSAIDEMPPGRLPVKTFALSDRRRDELIERVNNTCAAGEQVYWVCPLIEKSETLHYQTAEHTFALLQREMPQINIRLIHGRMSAEEKENTIELFKRGEVQLLVSTTVIEVGIDIPDANLIVIENAERFGLAQLHQLRGRVGRSGKQAACALLYHAPLSTMARRRLEVMRTTNDGFKIAQEDMAIRGPGEVLGTRQTGEMRFRIADLTRDKTQLKRVRELSEKMLADQPEICDKIIGRWMGQSAKYAEV